MAQDAALSAEAWHVEGSQWFSRILSEVRPKPDSCLSSLVRGLSISNSCCYRSGFDLISQKANPSRLSNPWNTDCISGCTRTYRQTHLQLSDSRWSGHSVGLVYHCCWLSSLGDCHSQDGNPKWFFSVGKLY